MDLFKYQSEKDIQKGAPLADRMRPQTLDEFVGQEHILGEGRLLRRAIQADRLSSLIFYGPPGTGKTTLARIIANTTKGHFLTLNAVLAGVKDLRKAIEEARNRREMYGKKTILFVDEVHRWNKAQQDALLPWVEKGILILIGATTENPYFEVIKALVSRSRIFQLKGLLEEDLREMAHRALGDKEKGYGEKKVSLSEEARDHLVHVANGDGRSLLNALELAIETTPPLEDGTIPITLEVAEESIQRRAVLYDKEGDVHYDVISAFIKSLRGSDPDSALYWMAKMVYSGEDPRFIFRRMVIFASEDIGLADPRALEMVMACAQAFDYVGMPEGRFPLSQAALYLATAPKSNSTLGFFQALSTVEKEREDEVPTHLKDGNRDKEGFGHGQGYLYPHSFRDHWVAQQYMPQSLQGRVFYQPNLQGYEKTLASEVARRRELQLAAMVEEEVALPEILTFTGEKQSRERDKWLNRAVSGLTRELEKIQNQVMDRAFLKRHHLVLVLNPQSGILLWESLRRAPEGGVWALLREEATLQRLREQGEKLEELERPSLVLGELGDLPALLGISPVISFDAILSWNGLFKEENKAESLHLLSALLKKGGTLSVAETIPRHTQRLYRLVNLAPLGEDLAKRVEEAEETIYQNTENPLINWNERDLKNLLKKESFEKVEIQLGEHKRDKRITASLIDHWFSPKEGEKASYADHLLKRVSREELREVQEYFKDRLKGRIVPWFSKIAYISGRRR